MIFQYLDCFHHQGWYYLTHLNFGELLVLQYVVLEADFCLLKLNQLSFDEVLLVAFRKQTHVGTLQLRKIVLGSYLNGLHKVLEQERFHVLHSGFLLYDGEDLKGAVESKTLLSDFPGGLAVWCQEIQFCAIIC